ncbi:hypothetical protein [Dehalobacter sp.]|uniref:hypothetical protein n=1 Tax=Dehalobacter sp. TaxID=1962289 RepID=UPI0025828E93|nr:hypothetical protein [Dehalobacter sp.]MDJ0305377.1 hypothetical protein [Dehalobacter sp.]
MEIENLRERFWEEADKEESFDLGELALYYVPELEHEISVLNKSLKEAHTGYLDQISQLQARLTDIKNMVERLEIVSADKTTKAKEDWQYMALRGHENTYATSLRYEVWREAATMFADLGAAIDKVLGGTGK